MYMYVYLYICKYVCMCVCIPALLIILPTTDPPNLLAHTKHSQHTGAQVSQVPTPGIRTIPLRVKY